jgi:hypothetical protein
MPLQHKAEKRCAQAKTLLNIFMQRLSLLCFIFCLILLSCKKEIESRTIDGKWHMWYVQDKTTKNIITKANDNPDVNLVFKSKTDSTGMLIGQSVSTELFSTSYILSSKRADLEVGDIRMPSFTMSNTADTGWVKVFKDKFPKSERYVLESDTRLFFHTSNNQLISFRKQ